MPVLYPNPVIPGGNYGPQAPPLSAPVIPQGRRESTRRRRRRRRYSDEYSGSSSDDSVPAVPVIPQPAPPPNPLPQPPRDVFETTPWRNVIQNLPRTDEQLLARTGSTARVSPQKQRRKSGNGLFRNSTDARNGRPEQQSNGQYPAYPIESNGDVQTGNDEGILAGSSTLSRATSVASANAPRQYGTMNMAQHAPLESTAEETYQRTAPLSAGMTSNRGNHTNNPSIHGSAYQPPPMPLPPPDSSQSQPRMRSPPILFDRLGEYRGFLNHSPHRIRYRDKTYPTATHLSEAIKFLPDHPDIAEAVRTQETVHDAYQFANQNAQYVQPDWPNTFLTRVRTSSLYALEIIL